MKLSSAHAIGILLALLAHAGCAQPGPKHEYTLAPGRAFYPGLAHALIVPINESADVPAGLDIADDRLESLLDDYLRSKGITPERPKTNDYRRAARIAVKRATAEAMSGESGRVSGSVDYAQVVPRLLEELDVNADLVIVPNLALRSGTYTGGRAIRWDGVRRREKANLSMSGDGMPVASLFVVVYARDGKRLFSGYGGLDTIFEVRLIERKFVLREDRLSKEQFLKEGICIAFYPYFGDSERC